MLEVLRDDVGFMDAHFAKSAFTGGDGGIFVGPGRDQQDLGGRHFNEEGYRLLAEFVLERLRADGVIDSDL
jgi:lysophospholipase L1-like esterase